MMGSSRGVVMAGFVISVVFTGWLATGYAGRRGMEQQDPDALPEQ